MPDQNEVVLDTPRVTVAFERSLKVRDYETAKASIYLQVPTTPEMLVESPEARQKLVDAIKPTFFIAKSVVFEQLGIDFEVTPEGVAQEILEKALGAVEVTQAEAAAVAAASNVKPTQGIGAAPAPATRDEQWAELCEHPKRWFDNRETKTGNSPDFRRKYTKEGLWLTFKGNNNVPAGLVVPGPEAF